MYIQLLDTRSVDCYWVGAVSNVSGSGFVWVLLCGLFSGHYCIRSHEPPAAILQIIAGFSLQMERGKVL